MTTCWSDHFTADTRVEAESLATERAAEYLGHTDFLLDLSVSPNTYYWTQRGGKQYDVRVTADEIRTL